MTPRKAYLYAYSNHSESDFDLNYYQKIACEDSYYAYVFAKYIPGADIAYCRKACEYDKNWLNLFDIMIIEKAML